MLIGCLTLGQFKARWARSFTLFPILILSQLAAGCTLTLNGGINFPIVLLVRKLTSIFTKMWNNCFKSQNAHTKILSEINRENKNKKAHIRTTENLFFFY